MNAEEELQFKRCPLLNISQCDVSENARSFIVTVYNPLARRVNKFVRIPIKTEKLIVTDVTSGSIKYFFFYNMLETIFTQVTSWKSSICRFLSE